MIGSVTATPPPEGAALQLAALRQRGAQRYASLGLPKTRVEAWRYFPTRALSGYAFDLPPEGIGEVGAAEIAPWLIEGAAGVAVFIDGHFSPDLSDLAELAERVRVGGLASAIAKDPERSAPYLGQLASSEADGLVAASDSWFCDGLSLEIPAGVVVEAPILALFFHSGVEPRRVRQPRNLVVMGRSSQATLVCRYVGAEGAEGVTNAVTELVLGEGAVLRQIELEEEPSRALHVSQVTARQAANSQLRSFVLSLGGAAARTALRAELAGPGAECSLDGLYLSGGDQRLDHYTEIDHLVGHTTSFERYAGVMDGDSTGNFQGIVYIREGATKSATEQLSRSLLLSEGARANAKPQLEIDNDDVKAAHGATVGQLDQAALFYLESRGIDPATARGILTYAFAREALTQLDDAQLIAALEPRVRAKLHSIGAPEELDEVEAAWDSEGGS